MNTKRKVAVWFVAVTVILLSFVLWIKPHKDNLDRDTQIIQAKMDDLLSRISPTAVRKDIEPVIILRKEGDRIYAHCMGGKLVKSNQILTCGHAFWDIPSSVKGSWKFYYLTLHPLEKVAKPINRIETIEVVDTNTLDVSRDVLICIPGESRIISQIPGREEQDAKYPAKLELLKVPQTVRSTITGESVRVMGSIKWANGPYYTILDYQAFVGESGTIFAGTEDVKTLYVLSKRFLLNDEFRKSLGLPQDHQVISFCATVDVN